MTVAALFFEQLKGELLLTTTFSVPRILASAHRVYPPQVSPLPDTPFRGLGEQILAKPPITYNRKD